MPINYVKYDKIIIGDRQRKTKPTREHIDTLKQSIVNLGLLHPIVLCQDGDNLHLVAGECRLTAMIELCNEQVIFKCGGTFISPDEVPYTLLEDLTPNELQEAELEENILRAELPWQDRINAIAKIHEAKVAKDESQTIDNTAKEISDATGKSQSRSRGIVSDAILIKDHLDDPEIRKARTAGEAKSLIQKKSKNILKAELARRASTNTDIKHNLIQGDCIQELKNFPDGEYDLILSDPPYGVDAKNFKRQVQARHQYDDSYDNALEIYTAILKEGFRITTDRANIFLFCNNLEMIIELQKVAKDIGWDTWNRPLIWKKSNEGIRPWGMVGFAFTYEFIFFARKSGGGLKKTHSDIFEVYKVTHDKQHGAQKPEELYEQLIDVACVAGDKILDPCCGSGTIFPSASSKRCIATGIELDDYYYDIATQRMYGQVEEGEEDVE